ncbi:MAG: CocE/NonD family hydrolase C-terminal non-catalytic domain-containing protein [Mycobacteriales bacterium]
MRFAGTPMARFFVSTTGTDAALTVRLQDVAPNGTAILICPVPERASAGRGSLTAAPQSRPG